MLVRFNSNPVSTDVSQNNPVSPRTLRAIREEIEARASVKEARSQEKELKGYQGLSADASLSRLDALMGISYAETEEGDPTEENDLSAPSASSPITDFMSQDMRV